MEIHRSGVMSRRQWLKTAGILVAGELVATGLGALAQKPAYAQAPEPVATPNASGEVYIPILDDVFTQTKERGQKLLPQANQTGELYQVYTLGDQTFIADSLGVVGTNILPFFRMRLPADKKTSIPQLGLAYDPEGGLSGTTGTNFPPLPAEKQSVQILTGETYLGAHPDVIDSKPFIHITKSPTDGDMYLVEVYVKGLKKDNDIELSLPQLRITHLSKPAPEVAEVLKAARVVSDDGLPYRYALQDSQGRKTGIYEFEQTETQLKHGEKVQVTALYFEAQARRVVGNTKSELLTIGAAKFRRLDERQSPEVALKIPHNVVLVTRIEDTELKDMAALRYLKTSDKDTIWYVDLTADRYNPVLSEEKPKTTYEPPTPTPTHPPTIIKPVVVTTTPEPFHGSVPYTVTQTVPYTVTRIVEVQKPVEPTFPSLRALLVGLSCVGGSAAASFLARSIYKTRRDSLKSGKKE